MVATARPSTIALRDYQQEAIEAINQAEMDGIASPPVALPTGCGKTIIFSHLIDQRPGRSLVLAHQGELIQQSVDKLKMVNPDLSVGIVKAEAKQVGAPVVVGSVRTLSRPNRLEQLDQDFGVVVVD
jgi:superfamily II DNA or RNA helicase